MPVHAPPPDCLDVPPSLPSECKLGACFRYPNCARNFLRQINLSANRSRRPMSAIGTKRTSPVALHMSAFGGKADIAFGIPRQQRPPDQTELGSAFLPALFKPCLAAGIDPIRRLFLSGPLKDFFRRSALKHGPNGPYRRMRCLPDDQFWLFVIPNGTF